MQIAVAEQSPQPLKAPPFSVFVRKKYRPRLGDSAPRARGQSIAGITALRWDDVPNTCAGGRAPGRHVRRRQQLIKPLSFCSFAPRLFKVELTFLSLLLTLDAGSS